jgi:hypothetical protein
VAGVTPGQRVREVLNWVNGSTVAGLLIAGSGRAVLARHKDGIWTATQYRGIASRRPFAVGNVLLTRHDAAELARRPKLRAHEVRHSTQWAVLGPAFVPLYLTAMLFSRALAGDTAAANPFELLAGLSDGGYARRPPRWRAAQTPS